MAQCCRFAPVDRRPRDAYAGRRAQTGVHVTHTPVGARKPAICLPDAARQLVGCIRPVFVSGSLVRLSGPASAKKNAGSRCWTGVHLLLTPVHLREPASSYADAGFDVWTGKMLTKTPVGRDKPASLRQNAGPWWWTSVGLFILDRRPPVRYGAGRPHTVEGTTHRHHDTRAIAILFLTHDRPASCPTPRTISDPDARRSARRR